MVAVDLALLLITLANAKDSVPWSAQVKSDPRVNFGAYKTYSWLNLHAHSAPWGARIKSAINATLASKGWNQIDSGGDVSIVVLEMTKEHGTLTSYYDQDFYGGWGWRWGSGFPDPPTDGEGVYEEGTLVVDLFDSRTKNVIWRGSLRSTLSGKLMDDDNKLKRGVNRLFTHFPRSQRSRDRSKA
jgi:hypothetical protein